MKKKAQDKRPAKATDSAKKSASLESSIGSATAEKTVQKSAPADKSGQNKYTIDEYKVKLEERTDQLAKVNKELEAEITDRMQAEEFLTASETYFRALIEHANDFILVLNRDGTIRFASPSVGRKLGYKRKQLTGHSLFSLLHPDDVPENMEKFRGVAGRPGSSNMGISRARDTKGRWFVFEGIATNMLDDPSIRGIIVNAWNVTDWLDAQERLQTLTNMLLEVREDERAAMAREVHDELGQEITGLRMSLASIGNKLKAEGHPLADKMTESIGQIGGMTKSISRIAHGLRSNLPDKIGLAAAVNWECEKLRKEHGIKCRASIGSAPKGLPSEFGANIYRIVQEALTNIVRHSGARTVTVNLSRKAKNLLLTIADDGKGMTYKTAKDSGSFGLISMRERVERMGGSFEIKCARGKGVTITVSVPMITAASGRRKKS